MSIRQPQRKGHLIQEGDVAARRRVLRQFVTNVEVEAKGEGSSTPSRSSRSAGYIWYPWRDSNPRPTA